MPLVIEKPTMILNPVIARRNIARMAQKAARSGVRFRPHFKTHQSAIVGEWFRDEGVEAITVSSVDMAGYFAAHGWADILIAFPVNWLEIEKINRLAADITLGLLVESPDTVMFLWDHLQAPARVWLKIDTGYGRTGLAWDDFEGQRALAEAIRTTKHLTLDGLLTHAGHSYGQRSADDVRLVYRETVGRLLTARDELAVAGFTGLAIAPGDTPCCSVVQDFSEVDEIRPGCFVFYDIMQVQIGACQHEDIAMAVACPVVARHPDRGEIVIYGGAVHLSKERLTRDDGATSYGDVALPTPGGWSDPLPDCYVKSISQEHGIIRAEGALVEQVQVGDVVLVLPVHACLTANLMKTYYTPFGDSIPMAEY